METRKFCKLVRVSVKSPPSRKELSLTKSDACLPSVSTFEISESMEFAEEIRSVRVLSNVLKSIGRNP